MSSKNSLFIKHTLHFSRTIIDIEKIPISVPDAKFGILNLTAMSSPLNDTNQEIVF